MDASTRADPPRVPRSEARDRRATQLPGQLAPVLLPTLPARPRASGDSLDYRPVLRQAPDVQALHQELHREGRVLHGRG